MAWSDNARRAAAEARRRKRQPKYGSRSLYASELKAARKSMIRRPGENRRKFNRTVRKQAEFTTKLSTGDFSLK